MPSVPVHVQAQTQTQDYNWVYVLVILVVGLYFIFHFLRKVGKKPNPPFIEPERVPDLKIVTQDQFRPLVQEAFGRVYGERNFDVIGDVQGGIVDGPQTVFFLDGSHRTENFNKEDGFRARLRFKSSGVEALVVGKLGCFNPCWSAERAEFSGTFTPYGSNQPEIIDPITENEAGDIGENIRRIKRGEEVAIKPPTVESPTAVPAQEPPVVSEPKISAPKGPEIQANKIQISKEKGITIEGKVDLTFDQFKDLAGIVMKKD